MTFISVSYNICRDFYFNIKPLHLQFIDVNSKECPLLILIIKQTTPLYFGKAIFGSSVI